MRELKFRAWDIDCHRFEYFKIGENDDCYGMFRVSANKFGSVVEQSTGLKDKNGKEIYEGDIVQDSKEVKCKVGWNAVEAHFGLYVGKQMELTDFIWMRGDDLEVIGNIHENPELLGVKE